LLLRALAHGGGFIHNDAEPLPQISRLRLILSGASEDEIASD
jgi:hypothetical protein